MGLLKAIGDGVAFLYLSKWDLKTMVFKEKPGFISGKEGLSLERRVLREAFARGGFAILNDLTTCLRYGDLTVPGAEGFMIIELKSGGTGARSDRAKRQVEKIEK
jgi:hypothetical protein